MTFRKLIPLGVTATLLMLAACQPAPPPQRDFTAFNREKPRSILVVPVVNRSAEVNAPDGLLVTLPVPLAERGFYVSSTHMVGRTMEDDGLGDADLVHGASSMKLAKLFGADAVLYAVIEEWKSQYIVLSTTTTVAISYTLKSGETGETLWESKQRRSFSAGPKGIGIADLIVGAIAAAVEKASPNYLWLATMASAQAVAARNGQGVPFGPYYKPKRYDLPSINFHYFSLTRHKKNAASARRGGVFRSAEADCI